MARSPARRLWLNSQPELKLWRLDGKVSRSRPWSDVPPKLKLWRLDGKVTCSRLWLKFSLKLMLWRLDGKVTCSQALVEFPAKTQALKTRWQGYPFQALVTLTPLGHIFFPLCFFFLKAALGHFFSPPLALFLAKSSTRTPFFSSGGSVFGLK